MMSNFDDPKIAIILFAILVKRLGGRVEITQTDIDDIAFGTLEEGCEDGPLEFRLLERKVVS